MAVVLAVLLAAHPDGGVMVASPAALVRFHTACASCHASECSGRLSFQSGVDAATAHIRRYAPTAEGATVRELFALLTSLKRSCRVALPHADAGRTRWSAEELRAWRDPDVGAYFIPLGRLRPPEVVIELEGALPEAVEVLDGTLEPLAEAAGAMRVVVQLEAEVEGYLRVHTKALTRVRTR